ncbi:MAG: DUF2339 domain-containing protein [Oleispira sp.]
MEGLLLLSLGLIGYLFYRTSGLKNQLSTLHTQFYKLQQQFIQLQQFTQRQEPRVESEQELKSESELEPDKVELTPPELTPSELASTDVKEAKPLSAALEKIAADLSKTDALRDKPQTASANSPAPIPAKSKASPTAIEQAFSFVIGLAKNYFSQGNQIVRIGIIVLFFGMSFLAKYSIENSLISIEIRMVAILIASLVMLGIGWHLRIKNPAYGLMMQGGGIAIGYIAIFASFKMYQLIPATFTFPILIVFSLCAMALAVLQNSRALAVTAITGGFAAPILASTGQGSHIGLFSYYLVLNCAIFFVAWFKSWRLLNVIGFLFTFIIASAWGVTQYRSAQFASTEPFLITFFLIYVAISILFSIKQKPQLKGYVDGTLVFGVPMVAFGLQSALVHHMEYGLAYSSASLAAFYLMVSYLLRKSASSGKQAIRQAGENLQLMSQAMFALGIIFATLTLPFALDGQWSAASWAIEGAGFVWIALRQQRKILKYVGLALQLFGGLLFLIDYPYYGGSWVFINAEFMGITIISFSALFTAYLLQQPEVNISTEQDPLAQLSELKKSVLSAKTFIDNIAAVALIVWGIIWWYTGALIQVDDHISRQYELVVYVAFLTFSAALWLIASLRWQWQHVNFFPWLLLLPLCFYFWPTVFQTHFSANYGFIIWPLGLSLLYGIFYKAEQAGYALFKATALHTISYLLILSITAYELAWYVDYLKLAPAWCAVVVMVALIIALDLINKTKVWPFTHHPKAYHHIAGLIIIGLMLIWSIAFNFLTVLKANPIPYLPVVNPIDLFQLLALFVVVQWYRMQGNTLCERLLGKAHSKLPLGLLAVFSFIWFNVILLKIIHVATLVDYQPDALFNSAVVQTTLSIAWTVIGLVVMMFASNKSVRQLWFIGAALTAIVVAKLFLLDLAGQGTIERIISFIVVGALLLVVGYFSPVPPSLKAKETEESTAVIDPE